MHHWSYIVVALGYIGLMTIWALSGYATWPPPWYIIAISAVVGVVTVLCAIMTWAEWDDNRTVPPPRPSPGYRPDRRP